MGKDNEKMLAARSILLKCASNPSYHLFKSIKDS